MNKLFFAIAALSLAASAQDITVSKDSIQVYNNPASSFADQVTFTSHSSVPIHLDSAFVIIAEMDTVGYARPGFEVSWRSNFSSAQIFVWTMDNIGQNSYQMVKKTFSPVTAEPLSFSGYGDSRQMFFLEIGYCFVCELYPKYPRYIKGTMKLLFSNGQVVELKLWSNDLRTSVKSKGLPKSRANIQNSNVRYLADGRKLIVGDKANANKNRVARILFRQK